MIFDDLRPHKNQTVPFYRQLYERFRDAIATGTLTPGERVPSVRALASALNVARGTVETAYQILVSEGYLQTRGPAGTVVSPHLDAHAAAIMPLPPPFSHPLPAQPAAPRPFQLGLPALDAFPVKTWARLAGHRVRALDTAALAYPDPAGDASLRRAIATYLGIARGIACTHEHVFITAGYRGALDLIARTLLQAGDAGWFEDPGYRHARRFLTHAGLSLVPIPVDADGLRVEIGLQRAATARFAVVTPTHHSPSGVALALSRRLALLDWAENRHAWVIEDDYDSEFRYHGRPLPALKSLDRSGRVLYTGTFSKVLFPGLRLAYLVVPEKEIEKFRETAHLFHMSPPTLLQTTVSDFMEQGHFARHLKKMRTLYATRRGYLHDALRQVFGTYFRIPERAGGMHTLAYLQTGHGDAQPAARANAHGLAVQALSRWCMQETAAGLLLGFTNMATPEQAVALVQRLHAALGAPPSSP